MVKAPVKSAPTVGAPVVKPVGQKTVKPAAYNPIGNLGTFAHPAKKKKK